MKVNVALYYVVGGGEIVPAGTIECTTDADALTAADAFIHGDINPVKPTSIRLRFTITTVDGRPDVVNTIDTL